MRWPGQLCEYQLNVIRSQQHIGRKSMTQYPTPPSFPPGAGQMPYPQGGMMPPSRSNAMAIVSLILGILGCIPVITGLGAIIFGILGIRASNRQQIGGKGMAIAGL